MKNMSIDLHCHSRFSDGSTDVADIMMMAKLRGVKTIAITDHDTLAGVTVAQKFGRQYGIEVVPGVEISAVDKSRGKKVHVLCYYPTKPEYIEDVINKTTKNRYRAMLDSIEVITEMFPVTKEMILKKAERSTCIFKQHVMEALMDAGFSDKVFGDLFKELYDSKTGKAYKNVDYPDVFDIIGKARLAGCVVVLAHPSEYKSIDLMYELASKKLIDGIELYHPRNTAEDMELIKSAAEKYGLFTTGGTDFHGCFTTKCNPIGTFTTSKDQFEMLKKVHSKYSTIL